MLNALVVILTCLFVYLKLTGAIYWSWLMVFSPIIAFVLYSIFVLVCVVVHLV